MVLEERTDGHVEVVALASHVGDVMPEEVGATGVVGARVEDHFPAFQRLQHVDGETQVVDVGEPHKLGEEFGENHGRAFGLDYGNGPVRA